LHAVSALAIKSRKQSKGGAGECLFAGLGDIGFAHRRRGDSEVIRYQEHDGQLQIVELSIIQRDRLHAGVGAALPEIHAAIDQPRSRPEFEREHGDDIDLMRLLLILGVFSGSNGMIAGMVMMGCRD
jgi:hypothetical protein